MGTLTHRWRATRLVESILETYLVIIGNQGHTNAMTQQTHAWGLNPERFLHGSTGVKCKDIHHGTVCGSGELESTSCLSLENE